MSANWGLVGKKGGEGGGGERIICWWMVIEDFQYGISRFWKKYGREMVFPTLGSAGSY